MLVVKALRIDYEDVTAVVDLNLEISQGQIFGLVGPNGAGKTSTIKAIAGVLEPTYGHIEIAGYDLDLQPEEARQRIGYMPDFPPVYENLKVWEYCDVFAAAYLIPRPERLKRVRYWVEQVNLLGKWDSFIRDLSRGMRQRLVLAKTLLSDPAVLLLDEPASGLDPIARKEFSDILKRIASQGRVILISSHILTELSDFCNAVGVMEKGRMVVAGTLEEIRRHIGATGQLNIRCVTLDEGKRGRLLQTLAASTFVRDFREAQPLCFQAVFSGSRDDASRLLGQLILQQVPISDFYVKEANVEDIFFKIGAKEVT